MFQKIRISTCVGIGEQASSHNKKQDLLNQRRLVPKMGKLLEVGGLFAMEEVIRLGTKEKGVKHNCQEREREEQTDRHTDIDRHRYSLR